MAISVPPFPIARFSVEQYHRMVRSGAFTEDDQLELIDGWVVKKMAKGPGHEFTTGELAARFQAQVPAETHVRNQAPITLDGSEPEPDLAIVRGSRSAYRDRHPGAADVLLVVEVSDTTLATDRLKARTYARAGIPEYWIVNLSERCIEVHREPSVDSGSYARCDVATERNSVASLVSGASVEPIAVRDVLP